MATLDTFTLRFYDADANPADFSQSQTTQLIKLLPGLLESQVHGSREAFDNIVTKLFTAAEGDSVYSVTIDKLISAVTDVTQRDLIVNNVAKVLIGDFGLLKGHPLYRPLLVGRFPDGRISIDGGRHRLAAVVSLLRAYGFPDEWILEVSLPCFVMNHKVDLIVHDNTSRGVTPYELTGIKVSSKLPDIDIRNPADVWKAYTAGALDGTPVTQRSNAMRLAFVANTEDSLGSILTADTRGKIASGLPNAFGKAFPEHKYALKDAQFLIKLMQFAEQALPEVIKKHQEMGVTILARATASLSNGVMIKLKDAVKSGTVKLPEKPQAVVKVTAEVAAKPKTSTTRSKKSKKATEAEAVA